MTQEYSIKHEKKSNNTSNNNILELPENKKVILLSSIYSGEDQKVLLKFYDPELKLIYFWKDRTNHKPYCYTKIEYKEKAEEIIEKEPKYKAIQNKKIDLITDKEINVIKIIAPDPLSIGGTNNSIREKLTAWEADIKYHENYLYDNALIPGTYYYRKNDGIYQYKYEIDPQIQNKLYKLIDNNIQNLLDNKIKNYNYYIAQWVDLLNQPIPNMKRIAIDIEVESEEGRIPNPRDHDRTIIAIGLAGNDGFRKVYILDDDVSNDKKPFIPEAEVVKTERELILAAFNDIKNYPIILTFNGDDFDLPYLYMRSQDTRIDPINKEIIKKEDIPFIVKRETFVKRGMQAEPVNIKHGIHIDLFRTFQNRSVQIYAFNHKYAELHFKCYF